MYEHIGVTLGRTGAFVKANRLHLKLRPILRFLTTNGVLELLELAQKSQNMERIQ